MKQPNIDAIRMCWMNESSSHRINRNMNLCAHFYRCCARFAHMMFIQMFAEGWPTRHNNRQFYSSMWPYLFHFICFYFYRRSAFVPSFFDVDVCVSHCCLPWHVRLFECLNSRSRLNVRVWAFEKMSISCIPSLTSYYCTLSLAQHFVWYSVSSRLASAQNTNLGTYHKMSPFFAREPNCYVESRFLWHRFNGYALAPNHRGTGRKLVAHNRWACGYHEVRQFHIFNSVDRQPLVERTNTACSYTHRWAASKSLNKSN